MTTNFDIQDNPILWTDGYKISHWLQYRPGTTKIFSYWMSRGGKFDYTIPLGMQWLIRTRLLRPITQENIDEAVDILEQYFQDDKLFNREGFEIILNEYGGHWPVEIHFAPEGTPIPSHNVLMTVENTDDRLPWVTNYVEGVLSQIWYPSTVSTLSRECKKVILESLERTGTPESIDYRLVDFGFRGVSSIESSGIGGFAHLVNFKATDTLPALLVARRVYGESCAGGSIPAAEHSTVTQWGNGGSGERNAFINMVKKFGDSPTSLFAVVSDSEDLEFAVREIWGKELKNAVLAAKNTLVVRPDSGVPTEIVPKVLQWLDEAYGHTVNTKGYKVLNKVRVIQGDGVNLESIKDILDITEKLGYSTDNLTFGMGGKLLQGVDRDTQKFAIKASWTEVNGQRYGFRKNPKTDPGKASRAGRIKLILDDFGGFKTVDAGEIGHNILEKVYRNGEDFTNTTLETIRLRAAL